MSWGAMETRKGWGICRQNLLIMRMGSTSVSGFVQRDCHLQLRVSAAFYRIAKATRHSVPNTTPSYSGTAHNVRDLSTIPSSDVSFPKPTTDFPTTRIL